MVYGRIPLGCEYGKSKLKEQTIQAIKRENPKGSPSFFMPCATCSTGRIIYRWGPNPGILLESVGERDPKLPSPLSELAQTTCPATGLVVFLKGG